MDCLTRQSVVYYNFKILPFAVGLPQIRKHQYQLPKVLELNNTVHSFFSKAKNLSIKLLQHKHTPKIVNFVTS